MKAFLLSGLCALSIACSPPPQKVAANRALLGDRLVNEKTFTDQTPIRFKVPSFLLRL